MSGVCTITTVFSPNSLQKEASMNRPLSYKNQLAYAGPFPLYELFKPNLART